MKVFTMTDKCEEDLFCGINSSSTPNPEEMNDLEKKHTPVIELSGSPKEGETFEVSVEVGKYLKLKDDDGWEVIEVGTKKNSKEVQKRSVDYRHQRKASDI